MAPPEEHSSSEWTKTATAADGRRLGVGPAPLDAPHVHRRVLLAELNQPGKEAAPPGQASPNDPGAAPRSVFFTCVSHPP